MFGNTKLLLAVISCALVAHAQSATTSAAAASVTPDACILTCSSQAAASAGCQSYTDLPCVCTSSAFQQAAGACIQANCTAADLATATQLQNQECAALSSGGASTTAATSTAPSGTSSAASQSASASASATSSKSGAMALAVPFSFGNVVGILVASAGVLVGSALTL